MQLIEKGQPDADGKQSSEEDRNYSLEGRHGSSMGNCNWQDPGARKGVIEDDEVEIGEQDLRDVWEWNAEVPETVETCVHDLITETARRQPEAAAVCAWDGNWTYGELDEVSTRLAHRLVSLGVGPKVVVPLCFEKSRWTPVAMVAVMKAGGASVALDMTQPKERLRTIVQQVQPVLMLSSSVNRGLAEQLTEGPTTLVVLDEAYLAQLGTWEWRELPTVEPWTTLYVVFTSGSTGTPKGVIITHSNISSAIKHQRHILGFDAESRVYDFASYMFDVVWCDTLQGLSAGSCLCIPSDQERKSDFIGGAARFLADIAIFTPSTIRGLDQRPLRGLRNLHFIGEPLHRDCLNDFAQGPTVSNLYGPTECTTLSTVQIVEKKHGERVSIGKGVGANTWVVRPSDHNYLAAVGSVGELLLEGPLVGAGYLGDAEKTAAAFIEDPPWLLRGAPDRPGRRGRLYKTGDLVRYNPDGSLIFIGRKDAQVKINGQRIELGDVEHHVSINVADDAKVQVVAEAVAPRESDKTVLIAFLHITDTTITGKDALRTETKRITAGLDDRLMAHLPAYMIPFAYIPVDKVSITATGKTDRRQLRAMGEAMTLEEMAAMNPSRVARRPPTTEKEKLLQRLWAQVLGIDADSIGLDDSFLRIGGDSIGAMRLVAAARGEGLLLTVADVFRQPTLVDLAPAACQLSNGDAEDSVPPLSLLGEEYRTQTTYEIAAQLCVIKVSQVEDVFPCTPMQKGLLAMTARREGDYVSRQEFLLRQDVDPGRLEQAMRATIAAMPILRTRVVDLPGQGLVQVVTTTEAAVGEDDVSDMKLGARLQEYRIKREAQAWQDGREQKSRWLFTWTLHHALYDGWSTPILYKAISDAYHNVPIALATPFQHFVKHVGSVPRDAVMAYWESQLAGSEAVVFPALPSILHQPQADKSIAHAISDIQWRDDDVTPSTIIRAAWAIVSAQYTNSSEAVFGATVWGRQAPVAGIERMAGPTIATVPIVVKIDCRATVGDLLQQVQNQAMEMVPYEQTGLQAIRRMSGEVARGSDFQTLVVIQPTEDMAGQINAAELFDQKEAAAVDDKIEIGGADAFTNYALSVLATPRGGQLDVRLSYDSSVISEERVSRLALQLQHVLAQLCTAASTAPVASVLDTVSDADMNDIWRWNAAVPETVDRCVHDMIGETMRRQPNAPAVCAWDGDFTYGELDDLSMGLARHLVGLGVKRGDIVPLCFEKSKWTTVAIIGVMRAGAASVLLDATLAEERLRTIVRQTNAVTLLSCSLCRTISSQLREDVVLVDSLATQWLDDSVAALPVCQPVDMLYVVFTSGSTGLPKGAMISHVNFATAFQQQQTKLAITRRSRVYDFASYAFDASWSNVLHTLFAGGCLCVPRGQDRTERFEAPIKALRANYAQFTPSVARTIDHVEIEQFETITLVGEPVTERDIEQWKERANIIIAYGPSECTVGSTIGSPKHREGSARDETAFIGAGAGLNCWVVEAENHDRLKPVGCAGELLLEGPLVGQGYLNDPEKTAAAFIDDPAWLVRGGPGVPGRQGRLYKTGDLVYYNPDGTLQFVGRKDAQVKINGQRVELGEIEHHVQRCLAVEGGAAGEANRGRPSVVVEAVVPAGGDKKVLVAFVAVEGEADGNATATIGRLCRGIEHRLGKSVPAYMIPTAYIAINEIPMTVTGKTDRRRLRAMGEAMTLEQMVATSPSRAKRRRVPTTEKEKLLQRLWARVLGIDAESIGLDDSFLRIGGDSIGAMRLVAAAREEGLSLTVADVFGRPKLVDLALAASILGDRDDTDAEDSVPPLSLLGEEYKTQATYEIAAQLCGIEVSQVEDVFPCTPMQEGLLAMTARRAGDYVSRQKFLLRQDVDPERLEQAMRVTTAAMPILRTRVVDLPGQGLVQVVTTTEAAVGEDDVSDMKLGARLQAYRIEREAQAWQDDKEQKSRWLFTWTLHHALYDGWSTPILYKAISDAYHNVPIALATPFQRFVKHVGSVPRDDVVAYWESQLAGSEAVVFPALPFTSNQPQADETMDHIITGINWRDDNITPSTIIRAAWAIVSAQYTNSSEAVFGATVSGRQAAVEGIERMAGPTMATVPVVIKLDRGATVGDLLRQVQAQATEMVPYEQTGLQAIRRMSGEVARCSEFQTLLVVQPVEDTAGQNKAAELFDQNEATTEDDEGGVGGADAFTNYALSIIATRGVDGVQIRLSHDSSVISEERVSRLALQLQHVLAQLCTAVSTAPVASVLDTVSDADMNDIWRWNAAVPETVDRCVHDMIGETMRRQPNAPAVCAWDGDFTYGELDDLSMGLARHLVGLGVKRGDIVPLCFEKSKWTTVAIIGVMRAGAASVLLDATLAEERLWAIVRQLSATTMLSTAANAPLAGRLNAEAAIVLVDTVSPLLAACRDEVGSAAQLPDASPSDRLYVVYTSGSSGEPKGVVISHANVCSALRHQRNELRFTASSRVFDAASYAFDAAWGILCFTLFAGGCLCVPSEHDRRNDATTSMIKLRVSYADITPSLADTIRVDDICSLQQAVFSGEALNVDTIERWKSLRCLLNVYGPAECTIIATIMLINPSSTSLPSIGRGIGQNTWIVKAVDHEYLLPVGCVGELLLEGPLVGQGYLNDPEKTAAAFIDDPAWLMCGGPGVPGRRGRLYKTGDLVYYNPDGTLQFVGRKDAQVKINGQRVELAEIEHHVQHCLAIEEGAAVDADRGRPSVVVEAVLPAGGEKKVLAAFVSVGDEAASDGNNATTVIQGLCGDIEDRLAVSLPAYMIPTAYIAIDKTPMTATGKTDRRRLRAMGEAMTLEQLAATNPSRAERRAPTTDKEKHLQSLWARVLGIDADSIGLNDSFLRIGGDSIGAMRLVAAAQKEGLSLTVAEVFRQPRLVDLALAARLLIDGDAADLVPPLSLLSEEHRTQVTYDIAAQLCGIGASQVEDVFPCTPMQEGLLAMTARRAGNYVSRQKFLLRHDVDRERFEQAMRTMIAAMPILRTRVVDLPGQGLVQVVTTTGAAVGEDSAGEIGLGTRLATYYIQKQQATAEGDCRVRWTFVWTLHHALYDGWSIPILYQALSDAYHNMQVTLPMPFQYFVKYVGSVQRDHVAAFWKSQLAGSEAVAFPALPTVSHHSQADKTIEHVISDIRWRDDGVTPSTLIRTAWAILSAQYTNCSEAVFGATVSGRQAPVAGIERIAGPTIATVPIVVKLDRGGTVGDLLRQVQDQATNMVAYEQTGLQAIRRMSSEIACGSEFQALIVVQPAEDMAGQDMAAKLFDLGATAALGDESGVGETDAFTNYALSVIASLARDGVKVRLSYDSSVISGERVSRLALQLRHVLAQLCAAASTLMVASVLYTVSGEDMDDIWRWNAAVPETVDRCVHDMIGETMQRQPDAPAICAWDGEFTYGELDQLSMRLARHLVGLGVKKGDIVPLCFEKSKWTAVAIMGVMRAGAASVLLDAMLPEERLRTIVRHVSATTVLSAAANAPLVNQLKAEAAIVIVDTVLSLLAACRDEVASAAQLPDASPFDRLYVVYTSGSTGTPKGVVISHANVCSALRHQRDELRFTASSRVFDAASYAFDAAWGILLFTLFAGGCLCVPSENDRRNDATTSMISLGVSYADITPSFADTIRVDDICTLQQAVFSGETLSIDTIGRWRALKCLLNVYGPAECTIIATISLISPTAGSSSSIGRGIGQNTWVVDAVNHESLLPVGCVGELLLEGPLVGQGYLHDPEKTAAAFIEDPAWLMCGGPGVPGRRGRLYKTGDLVYYNPDGTLQFVGRKDAQVKINGQRVELAEIEHHVQHCLAIEEGAAAEADRGLPSVVVEAVLPVGGEKKVLAAFVAVGNEAASDGNNATAVIQGLCGGIENRLAVSLPAYMIPTAYIAVDVMPMSVTGKADRRRLRAMGEAMTLEQLAATNPSRAARRAPTTEKETHLQRLWARVLGVDTDSIGLDDSFLRIGGDSIGAMRLVAAAREEGLLVTVAEVFRQPRLVDLASATRLLADVDAEGTIVPLSLLGEEHRTQATYEAVASLCRIDASQVEDVFPCTPMQEGLLAMTASREGDYVSRQKVRLRHDVDPERFEQAMRATIAAMPILRTRVVDLPGQGLVQVVTTTEPAVGVDQAREMKLGGCLATYRIEREAQAGQDGTKKKSGWLFTWTLHHMLYDGWSIPILYKALSDAYYNMPVGLPTPFQRFIKHIGSVQHDNVVAYWETQLVGSKAVVFPALPSISHQPQADKAVEHAISDIRWRDDDVTPSTIIRVAWAIVSAQYTNCSEAVFGATVSGRQAPVAGIERIAGPTIATVPIVVKLDRGGTVGDLLRQVQNQATEMVAYEQTGLQAIRRMSGEIARSSEFQTLLVVQPAEEMARQDKAVELFNQEKTAAEDEEGSVGEADLFTNYVLSVITTLGRDWVQVRLSYDSGVISGERVSRLALQLRHVLAQLCAAASTLMVASVLYTVSGEDMDDIWRWNAAVPETVDRCVHDMIGETMQRQPDAPAICAWDGEFTYGELDQLSMRLARHLVGLGVKKGDIVPLCFEKSKWTAVAIMGVMRAGAASVLLDAMLPEERLRTIVRHVSATTVLSAAANAPLVNQLKAEAAIVIVDTVLSLLAACRDEVASAAQLPDASPFDRLYVVYTSGSTGTPKGVVISHANVCSAFRHQRDELRFTASSRVFDAASYAFDAAWGILLFTLFAGGCLCVPSEDERRNDATTSMIKLRVSYADITPSFADTIRVDDICTLQQAVFSGETLSIDTIGRWRALKCLLNVYGPAECTIIATISLISPTAGSSSSIGRGIGQNTWVVDAVNHESLLPVGCVGELLLEGPLVGQGYLHDPEKTAVAFIEDPAWLMCGGPGVPGRRGRLYKTGDLVYYNPDGTLQFVGRKDAQVKINGQRVELAEIEHHVQHCLAIEEGAAADADRGRPSVVVEAVLPAGGEKKVLAAFVSVGDEAASDGNNATAVIQGLCGGIEDRLAVSLPAYMIPTAYIAVDELPMTVTGKTDRRRLRAMGEAMTLEQLAATNPSRAERRAPRTDKEKHLQRLWSRVLGIDVDSIGLDDSFLRIGGDSIGAMRLVAAAREEGLLVTVAEVFRHPRLVDLAKNISHSDFTSIHSYMPLSMISATFGRDALLSAAHSAVRKLHGSANANIEDVFPVTEFQEFCLKQPTSRCYHFYADIPFAFDTQFLVELFTSVFQSIDCLRSVFLHYKSLYFQAVLQGLLAPITVVNAEGEDIHEACDKVALKSHHTVIGLGGFFTHFFIIRGDELTRLILRVSHAQYDGVSLQLLASKLDDAFRLGTNQVQPQLAFSHYLYQAILVKNEALRYWRDILLLSRPTKLAAVSSSTLEQTCISGSAKSSRRIPAPCCPLGVTPASFFTTACAYAFSQISATDDVLFGLLVTGRSALHPSLHDVFGPCINIIPVRYQDSRRNDFTESCHQIQAQCAESRAYEMAQLRDIAQMYNSSEVLKFGAVIQFQDVNDSSWITTQRSSLSFKPMELATVQDDCFPEETLFVFAEPFEGFWDVCVSGAGRRYDDSFVRFTLESIIDIIHQATLRADAQVGPGECT